EHRSREPILSAVSDMDGLINIFVWNEETTWSKNFFLNELSLKIWFFSVMDRRRNIVTVVTHIQFTRRNDLFGTFFFTEVTEIKIEVLSMLINQWPHERLRA